MKALPAEGETDDWSCFQGRRLFGDDFGIEELTRWYHDEERGYHGIQDSDLAHGAYGYHALNEWHAWRFLRNQRRTFSHCLNLGGASGEDVRPIAPLVDRFTVIEPCVDYWTDRIGGKPAAWLRPNITGHLPVGTASTDLVTALGVLHHIANVSHVVREIGRVLQPNGFLILREPIHAMGDWRAPRPGLTRNERGIPVRLLKSYLHAARLQPLKLRYCMFGPLGRLRLSKSGSNLWNNRWVMPVDRFFSSISAWNDVYLRTHYLRKCAPGCIVIIARRTG